ncbi:peptidoglycan-binding domain-containing protein, partial [Patulibacter sp. S7RM1-6]
VRAGALEAGHRTARWDRPTVDAVARFQRGRGLPCTGVPDRRTADELLAA